MKLRWELSGHELARGFEDGGHELAQVARVYAANGDDRGWIVLLLHNQQPDGELFDTYATSDQAMAAAEAALDAAW